LFYSFFPASHSTMSVLRALCNVRNWIVKQRKFAVLPARYSSDSVHKDVPYESSVHRQMKDVIEQEALPVDADAVVIGGGSVGCSAVYHLVKKQCRSVVLLEKDRITSGTTWHTAGKLCACHFYTLRFQLKKHWFCAIAVLWISCSRTGLLSTSIAIYQSISKVLMTLTPSAPVDGHVRPYAPSVEWWWMDISYPSLHSHVHNFFVCNEICTNVLYTCKVHQHTKNSPYVYL